MKVILLVENSPYVSKYAKKGIEDILNVNAELVTEGSEAIEMINNGLKYAVLITDLSLKEGGYNILKFSKEKNPDIPTIVYSAYDLSKYPNSFRYCDKYVGKGRTESAETLIDAIKTYLK